jgi:GT2 family glycosyltransferase
LLFSRRSLRKNDHTPEKLPLKYTAKTLEPLHQPCDFKLSILIVNTNSGEMLTDCLESIYETVKTKPFEVIVVDNNSQDGSEDAALKRFPKMRLIKNDFNNWFTGGTNQALEESRGEYLLCLNPDTICHPHAIDGMMKFMEEHSSAGLVGPKLLNGDGTLQPSCRNFLTSRRLILQHIFPWRKAPNSWRKWAVFEYWDHDETMEVDWIIGACILLPRKAVEEVGLKDEGYPIFHEETDWCYQLRKAGWETWFLHDLEVTHFGSTTVSKLWGKGLVLEFYKGKHRFIRKQYGVLPMLLHRFLLTGLLSLRLAALLVRRIFSRNADLRQETSVLLKGIAIQLGLKG